MKKQLFNVALFAVVLCCKVFAQPTEQIVKVIVAPDHQDWLYKTGEKVKFSIAVYQYGNLLKNAAIRYEIGPERMDPAIKDSLNLSSGVLSVDGGTMKTPGFLRCIVVAKVEGKEYRKMATAGFDPLNIKPTVDNPADFSDFWTNAKNDLAKIPLDARITLLPERCTEKVNVYHVNMANYPGNARLYGILCVPKKAGKYPALLAVPGAGVR
ncbi:MAG: acetylxylan esterase, partial [Ginsengibacter sp.]